MNNKNKNAAALAMFILCFFLSPLLFNIHTGAGIIQAIIFILFAGFLSFNLLTKNC